MAEWKEAGIASIESYFDYDSWGNLVQEKSKLGAGWVFTNHLYDQFGNLVLSTDPNGNTATFEYSSTNSAAYLTKVVRYLPGRQIIASYAYDFSTGNLLSQTDPRGFTTDYQYDVLDRLNAVVHPPISGVRAQATLSYDDTNNILTITDEKGNRAKQYFDGLGRLVRAERLSGNNVVSSETLTYGWLDRVKARTTPTGATYTFGYDYLGRATRAVNPDSTVRTASYDDTLNQVTLTDENGNRKRFDYDITNRIIASASFLDATAFQAASYQYDEVGNLISLTDEKGQATSFVYDSLNRRNFISYPDGTNQTITYDDASNVVATKNQKGDLISYSYDELNRLIAATYPGGASTSFSYDDSDNNILSTYQGIEKSRQYDARNRLIQEAFLVDGTQYALSYGYDAASNLVSITYPDSRVIEYSYDSLNRPVSISSGHTTYATTTYAPDDKITGITYGNNVKGTYSYDSRDRLTQLSFAKGRSALLSMQYGYDGIGNILSINGESYTYDALARLMSVSAPWGTVSYSYDQAGNRLSKAEGGATTSYSYGAFNRLVQAGSTSYGYDANGNTVSRSDATASWSFQFDFEDRLTGVSKNGASIAQYRYDPDGIRVRSVEDGKTTISINAGLNVLYEKDIETGASRAYVYLGLLRIAKIDDGSTFYYHTDQLGSTRLVTDSKAKILFSIEYKPFGTEVSTSGSEPYRYGGKRLSSSTGLYYFHERFYDPQIGRFVTEDPVFGDARNSQTYNQYSFVVNNPLKYIDPDGRFAFIVLLILAGAAVGGGSYATFVGWTSNFQWQQFQRNWNWIHFGALVGVGAAAGAASYGLALALGIIGGRVASQGGSIAPEIEESMRSFVRSLGTVTIRSQGQFNNIKGKLYEIRAAAELAMRGERVTKWAKPFEAFPDLRSNRALYEVKYGLDNLKAAITQRYDQLLTYRDIARSLQLPLKVRYYGEYVSPDIQRVSDLLRNLGIGFEYGGL